MDIRRTPLISRMRKLGIDPAKYRDRLPSGPPQTAFRREVFSVDGPVVSTAGELVVQK
jgi:hypothetical protein